MNTNTCTDEWAGTEQIPSTEPQCPPAHYDVGRQIYWIQNEREEWISINETSLRRHLRKHGFSTKQAEGRMLSPVDECFSDIQCKFDVAYAGPLAGYRNGPVEMVGQRILVTTSPKLIEPEQRPFPVLKSILDKMFGDEQLQYFKAWLKISYESLASGTGRPGQALVFAGPADSYKSLLQNLITQMLGGRSAKPYRYMSGATQFNGDLFGAEHLMIEDDIASCDIRTRLNFGARIKEFTVNEVQSCHPKNRPALSLTPYWRVTISVNDEPENLLILPPLHDSVEDKLIMLKASAQPPVMPTVTREERLVFWQTLLDELPGFIWELLRWEIPKGIQGGRFAVRHFHHPDLIQALNDSAPETKLLALIDTVFIQGGFEKEVNDHDKAPKMRSDFKGTAEDLESTLTSLYPAETKRLFTWSNAIGTFLGRLAEKHPDRVKHHRKATARLWEVKPPPPMTP